MDVQALYSAVAAVCPIQGVRPGNPDDRSTWVIDFNPPATDAQRQAAREVVAAWVDVPPTPCVTGRQVNGQAKAAGITAALNTVLTSTTSAAKPDDIRYLNSVGLDTRMPIDNPKAARVLTLAGVQNVPAFLAAALLLPT